MESDEFISNNKGNGHLELPNPYYIFISRCWLRNGFYTLFFSKVESNGVVTSIVCDCIHNVSRRGHCNKREKGNEESIIVLKVA